MRHNHIINTNFVNKMTLKHFGLYIRGGVCARRSARILMTEEKKRDEVEDLAEKKS